MSKDKIIQSIVILVFLAMFGVAGYYIWRSVGGDFSFLGNKDTSEKMEAELAVTGQTYTHPDFGFTFKYPDGYTLGKFGEGEGEVILVQDAGNNRQGFQLYITVYEESEPLSKEIILKAAPQMVIKNEKKITLDEPDNSAEEGVEPSPPLEALVFDTENTATGDTHEIWFVAGENLYQASSYVQFGNQLETILKTFSFN